MGSYSRVFTVQYVSALNKSLIRNFQPEEGGTCYVGVPGDVPFSWVHFSPENSKQDILFAQKF